jgi:hypothetical protein
MRTIFVGMVNDEPVCVAETGNEADEGAYKVAAALGYLNDKESFCHIWIAEVPFIQDHQD